MLFEKNVASRCLIVGEVAQAHDGSLGIAHAHIDAIANAGADAVKFQTHIADAESTPSEPWRVRFSEQDESRFDYWKRMEFTEPQWLSLRNHAKSRGLLFISSPFSKEAVDLLRRVEVDAWKVASGEVNNASMFERMAECGLPMWLSTGMSPLSEIDAATARMQRRGLAVTVMQCTSAYPCPAEQVGLNMLESYRERYGCNVGLSDHSGTIYPGLAAVTLGLDVLEVHVTLSREMFGPDVASSVTTSELKQLVEGCRFIERMKNNPVDKDAMAVSLAPMRSLFTKSIVARVDLTAGTILGEQHLAEKKPGNGIPAVRLPQILGCKLRRGVLANAQIQEDDLEQ